MVEIIKSNAFPIYDEEKKEWIHGTIRGNIIFVSEEAYEKLMKKIDEQE